MQMHTEANYKPECQAVYFQKKEQRGERLLDRFVAVAQNVKSQNEAASIISKVMKGEDSLAWYDLAV